MAEPSEQAAHSAWCQHFDGDCTPGDCDCSCHAEARRDAITAVAHAIATVYPKATEPPLMSLARIAVDTLRPDLTLAPRAATPDENGPSGVAT